MKVIDLINLIKDFEKDSEIKIGREIELCGGRSVKCQEEIKITSIDGIIALIPLGKEITYDDIEYD